MTKVFVKFDLNDENDKSVYEEAFKEIKFIEDTSQKFKFNINHLNVENISLEKSKNIQKISSRNGHCIRCDAKIKLNPEHPLCAKCYKSWSKYSDPTYEEKFCHICGKKNKSSLENPVCYSCYKKSK